MGKLGVFNHVSLDGYFTDANGDMSWAHQQKADSEWDAFVAENAGSGGMLLFGRITYELMKSYWPTPMAQKSDAALAERMNGMPKVVFSRTLDQASWSNTVLIRDGLAAEVRRLKRDTDDDLTLLGSGTIITQLADEGLIDSFHLIVNPLALGGGRTMFDGMRNPLKLRRIQNRTFTNGNVLLGYEPVR